MSDLGVSVDVGEGLLKSFAPAFVERFGENSLFTRTLSDLWTSAVARLLIEKGEIAESAPVTLFSDEEALAVLRALAYDEAFRKPLWQESFGYVDVGTISN